MAHQTGLSPASQRLLLEVQSVVADLCATSAPGKSLSSPKLEKLRSVAFALKTSIGLRQHCSPSDTDHETLWNAVCDLWNLAVERHNHAPDASRGREPELRQVASDLLALLSDDALTTEGRATQLSFLTRTGQLWMKQGEHEMAEGCFATAMAHTASISETCSSTAVPDARREQLIDSVAELYRCRAQAAWALQQEELADDMLQQAKGLLGIDLLSGRQAVKLSIGLAHVLTVEGEKRMEQRRFRAAVSILDDAYRLLNGLADREEAEHTTAATAALQSRVVKLLAKANLDAGQPGPALNCIKVLQELSEGMPEEGGEGMEAAGCGGGTPVSHSMGRGAVAYLAMRALLALGRAAEAQTELLAVASSPDSPLPFCISGMKELLACGEEAQLAVVPALAEVLQSRFPWDPELPVGLVQALLASTTGTGEAAEAAALDLLHNDATMELLAQDRAKIHRDQLYQSLWNRGTERFYAKHYEACTQLFSASMQYCGDEAQRAKGARLLALCSLAGNDPDRALEFLEIATNLEPDSVYCAFIRFKVLLNKGDTQSAVAEIHKLVNCRGFDPQILKAVCVETMAMEVPDAAQEALKLLHSQIVNDEAGSQSGQEANVLQNLISVAANDSKASPAETQHLADQGDEHGNTNDEPLSADALATAANHFNALAEHCSLAADRLEHLGPERFYAQLESKVPQHEWFTGTAWNLAKQAADNRCWQAAAVMFMSAARMLAAGPVPSADCLKLQQVAYMMAATTTLEAHRAAGCPAGAPALALAAQCLAGARTATDSLHRQSPAASGSDDKSTAFIHLKEFELAVHHGDAGGQLAALRKCTTSHSVASDTLLEMCDMCKGSNTVVQEEALRAALSRLLQESRPRLDKVAVVTRELVQLVATDAGKLDHFKKAADMLGRIRAADYPRRELQWLVSTCWNRGCHHATFERLDKAVGFMEVALRLLDFCPELQDRKASMEGTLAEKRKEVVTPPTHIPASIDRPSSAIMRQDRADRSTSKSAMPLPSAAVTADGQGGACHLAAGASATAVGAELPHATVQLPRNGTAEEETASMGADTPLDLEVDDE